MVRGRAQRQRRGHPFMDIVIYSPVWFFGYDSIAEIISMVILFIIGFYARKIYLLTQEKKYKHLSLTFMLLGIAFFAKSLTTWIIYREWVEHELYIGKIIELYTLYNFGYLLHVLLSLAAYMLLLLLFWDIKDRRVVSLFLVFIVIAALFASKAYISFHIISFILLCYLTWEFWKNAHRMRKAQQPVKRSARQSRTSAKEQQAKTHLQTPYMVFGAFLIITLSQLVFLFMTGTPVLYVAGEVVQLIGYLLLLATLLIMIFRK